MQRSANQSRMSRHGLVLATPLFAAALWLLAPSSTALAANPPARRGISIQRTSVRIVLGGRSGDRRDNCRENDRCDDRRGDRHDDWGRDRRGDDCDDRGTNHVGFGIGWEFGRDFGRRNDPPHRDSRYGGDRYYGLDSEAWCDLTSGRYLSAKHEFLDQIECRPCEPIPRLGYAIACGRLGHDREAERSMRKAIDLDVDSLDALCVDSDLRRELRCLVDQYQSQLRHCGTDADTHFMIASLQTILGNYEAALCSVETARRFGDCSTSARSLQCFIESHLKCEPHREGRGPDRGRH